LPTGIIVAVIDIALIVHAARSGRFMPWGWIILFLPGIGALAYVVVEMAPAWFGSRSVRQARGQIAGALNPTRRYRELREQLQIVDTVANRVALAEECLALGKYDEALGQYNVILANPLGEEPAFTFGKAQAQFGLGDAGGALATLDALKRQWPDYQSPEAHLLYAIALDKSGRGDEALTTYEDVGRYYPGAEPRVRQAQLLLRLGRAAEAKEIASDVARTLGRAPAHVRRAQAQWLTTARQIAG
jgi:hypothetical protein